MGLPEHLQKFVQDNKWTFAKTYAQTWPHEYLVKNQTSDPDLFEELVRYIHENSYVGRFYRKAQIYLDLGDGYIYWLMGYPIEDTWPIEQEDIINRCLP